MDLLVLVLLNLIIVKLSFKVFPFRWKVLNFFSYNLHLHMYIRALHLRFEKGMVGLSFCDFVGTRMEKALMALYRLKEWPRRFKVSFC